MVVTKARWALAIVVAMGLFPAGHVVAAEVSTQSATLQKTYVNKRYGFAFDYPASWSLVAGKRVHQGVVLSLRLLSQDENIPVMRDYSPGSFSIEVWANPDRRPLREWLDEHGWPFEDADRSVTAGSLHGRPSLEVSTGKMFAPNRFIYVANKEWVLRMSTLAPDAPAVVQSLRFDP